MNTKRLSIFNNEEANPLAVDKSKTEIPYQFIKEYLKTERVDIECYECRFFRNSFFIKSKNFSAEPIGSEVLWISNSISTDPVCQNLSKLDSLLNKHELILSIDTVRCYAAFVCSMVFRVGDLVVANIPPRMIRERQIELPSKVFEVDIIGQVVFVKSSYIRVIDKSLVDVVLSISFVDGSLKDIPRIDKVYPIKLPLLMVR